MIRHVAVGYDFSEHADDALGWAVDLARAVKATVSLIHVVDAREDDPAVQELRVRLARVADEVGPEVSSHVVCAERVADGLVEHAERYAFDLIVVATRGLSGVERLILGSVADAVIRRARVPVVTVRYDDD